MSIGKQIKHVMIDMGISNKELASRIDCSPQNVSFLLNGKSITEANLYRIAEALECDVEIKFIPREKSRTRENS